jgi:TolA-binding protein
MEYGIGIGLLLAIVAYFLLGRKTNSIFEHEKKDIALEVEQEEHGEDLKELEEKLNNLQKKMGAETPPEVEDYWNEDNN